MEQLIGIGKRTFLYVSLLLLTLISTLHAQPSSSAHCQVTTVPLQVRAEGLTERLGDISLQCSGSTPGTLFTGNFTLYLPVSVTNRIDSSNQTRDVVFSVDLGSGPVPTTIAGQVSGNSIAFNGISYTVPASGNINLKISNVRAAVNQLSSGSVPVPLTGSLSSSLAIDQSQFVLGYSQAGLLSNMAGATVTCVGSALPDTINLANLFAAGTVFASTRVTEGFGAAFEAKSPGLDTGTRILVKYSGFPTTARIFVPDAVAGSDALKPTSGGDLNLPQSIGQYMPGDGSLVLVRVQGADASGAGGFAVSAPQGSAPVTLGSVSEVAMSNGSGYVVYEVAAANPGVRESAQFPSFFYVPAYTQPAVAQETVALAPLSTIATASITAPIPRFTAVEERTDCNLFGDCGATPVVTPKLRIDAPPILITAVAAGGAMVSAPGTFRIFNDGGSSMPWTTQIIYPPQSTGWLVLDAPAGSDNATVKVTANTKNLAAGIYQATVIVNAAAAGSQSVPVVLTVSAAPAPPTPPAPTVVVTQVLNAATLQVAPLVPGSLGTLMGTHLGGKSVAVTFDGTPATLLYSGDTQINLLVPASLGSKTSASLVVTADGVSSTPLSVPLAIAWPAVFSHGVLNQDSHENTPSAAAKSGDILQIFATGIPRLSTVSVQIGGVKDLVPVYAGDAPDVPGVQQVNVAVPKGVSGSQNVLVCANTGGQQYCSPAYTITVQ
ncbi:MAG: hypothetical protein JWP63_4496 [Candidatus Solibacter sp.]|nr:hypothetical protein [Candidatus Solibacter sp.]